MRIKSDREVKKMRKSGEILVKVLKEVKKNIKVGVTTEELDNLAYNLIIRNNASPAFLGFHGYPKTSCISINEEIVHAIPKKRIIKSGDIVSFDCGVNYEGYNTDAAFTVWVGKIDPQVKQLINTTQKSLKNAINAIKPGKKIYEIQKIIQDTAQKSGFSVIRDLSGHGIGKRVHEPPAIFNYPGRGKNFVLKKNMTFCLEPMICMGKPDIEVSSDKWTIKTKDNGLSAHFEHTILITNKGCVILA